MKVATTYNSRLCNARCAGGKLSANIALAVEPFHTFPLDKDAPSFSPHNATYCVVVLVRFSGSLLAHRDSETPVRCIPHIRTRLFLVKMPFAQPRKSSSKDRL